MTNYALFAIYTKDSSHNALFEITRSNLINN